MSAEDVNPSNPVGLSPFGLATSVHARSSLRHFDVVRGAQTEWTQAARVGWLCAGLLWIAGGVVGELRATAAQPHTCRTGCPGLLAPMPICLAPNRA